ncbi:tripartite tricarboxylate transporter substrate-binding protein [Paracidovorax citrulli]
MPYKGAGNYTTGRLSGQVQMGFLTVPAVLPLFEAGKLKAIGVSTPERVPTLPGVPTLVHARIAKQAGATLN